jgi:hypothetical protein
MSPLSQKCIISNLKRIGVLAIKKLKMLKCAQTLHIFDPALGAKPLPQGILVEVFLLYITM